MRNIYLYIVAATLILGYLMPQKGEKRKQYIIVMTLIHIFVSGFRYQFLTGDLMKYNTIYNTIAYQSWFSEDVLQEGRNFGFFWLMKAIYFLTNGNYQTLLFAVTFVIHVVLAIIVYRYSPAPWMSYLVWNCLAFYIFGFSAVKQSLAMAFVMLSFIGIAEGKLRFFLLNMLIAGSLHMPALVFLPAYWFCQLKVKPISFVFYLLMGTVLFLLKDYLVEFVRTLYYEDTDMTFKYSGSLGNRFVMILAFTLFSLLFTGYDNPHMEKLFHIMAFSTMLQMFSSYDNVFTRMTDYYFQFSTLYLPMLFFNDNQPRQSHSLQPVFLFNKRSRNLLAGLICVFIIWFYYTYNINISIASSVDDYLNYRFMWDVK